MSPQRSQYMESRDQGRRAIAEPTTRASRHRSIPSADPQGFDYSNERFSVAQADLSSFYSHQAPESSHSLQSLRAQEYGQPLYRSNTLPPPGPVPEQWPTVDSPSSMHQSADSISSMTSPSPMAYWYHESKGKEHASHNTYQWPVDDFPSASSLDSMRDDLPFAGPASNPSGGLRAEVGGSRSHQPQRRPSNRDEFDGPHQFLERPNQSVPSPKEHDLPQLSTSLLVSEQDEVLHKVNECLSRCAFDFVARYQFPIPLEPDKRPVKAPSDREWTEWVFLLKRLATKRRIPARVLYNGQIKQFVTVLENSMEMRHAAKHQSRPLKDDRNVLQLISAGLQVAKILKDPQVMAYLDRLYEDIERKIAERRNVSHQTGIAGQGPQAAYMPQHYR